MDTGGIQTLLTLLEHLKQSNNHIAEKIDRVHGDIGDIKSTVAVNGVEIENLKRDRDTLAEDVNSLKKHRNMLVGGVMVLGALSGELWRRLF